MTDIYDQATEREERDRALSLSVVLARKPAILPNGQCYNCGHSLAHDGLFCDGDCRDDWQARNPNK